MPTPDTFAFFHPKPGYLRLKGEDRVDFLQRQTTNDLEGLQADDSISTVLTNPSARIIDVLQIIFEDDETLAVVTLPGRSGETRLFLKRRIFFMDKVTVTDASEEISIIDIEGAGSSDVLATLGITIPQTGKLVTGEIGGGVARTVRHSGPGGHGFRLIISAGQQETVQKKLSEADIENITPEQYEALRVSAGIPGEAHELTEEFTPLETGLNHLISETKGCYTGQEIIARQITYDKITRSLVGIELEGQAESGARVLVSEQNVGSITSYAETEDQSHRAMAVIKRPHFEPGTAVQVEANGTVVAGIVTKLPFPTKG